MSAAPIRFRKSKPEPNRTRAWLDENFQLVSNAVESDSTDSEDDSSGSDVTEPPIHKSRARKNMLILSDEDTLSESEPVPPESESEEDEQFPAPPEEIVTGLQLLTSPLRRLERNRRLPFLRWNLQRGFELFCRSAGISLDEEGDTSNAMLIYRQIGGDRWETALKKWCCPLCNLHGIFRCRILLEKHIEFDHSDVHVRWLKRQMDGEPTWILRVTIPRQEDESPSRGISPSPEKLARELSPELPPSPPRERDPLGPAACMPYFPAKSEYGGPDMKYSCRPGGGRLYDLLGTLPMEPYGVLGWLVLDKEDEIFDSNMKDEHKVMHALWARWIMLNKNLFVQNFFNGTCKFVSDYWRMIHLAAGWRALRYWLLLLLSNGFLSGAEVARVLEHYEDLVKRGPSVDS